jgi:ABC-type bacteriocin/lantibiotic exporter with double-glycine peptidase domain
MAGSTRFGSGMPAGDRPMRGAGKATTADLTKSRPKPKLKKVMPEVWKLVKPRRLVLSVGFLLMIVNRACGLVLPASMRPLIDKVMTHGQLSVLPLVVGAVVSATILQGVTSYALTQLLSKAGQRLITDLRMQVQAHIGKLPVAFYDENRTGTLVARIMTDVEGVRNLIGTGVIDFFGGVLTAVFAFCYLIRLSYQMTLLTFVILVLFGLILQKAFKTADLPGAVEDQRGGDGTVDGVAGRGAGGEGIPRGG